MPLVVHILGQFDENYAERLRPKLADAIAWSNRIDLRGEINTLLPIADGKFPKT